MQFIFYLFFILLLGAAAPISTESTANKNIHELLPKYGLPVGLLPGNVVNYTLSADGEVTVELSSPCYIQFSLLAYYDKIFKGKVSYGRISDISGIQGRKFFVWASINNMNLNVDDGTIQFNDGILSEKLPVSEFNKVRPCENWVSLMEEGKNEVEGDV